MTLASRLSTQANLGKLDTLADIWELGVGNLSLIQVLRVCKDHIIYLLKIISQVNLFNFNY